MLSILVAALLSQNEVKGVKLPPGFTITEFAGPELVDNCFCIAFDPKGQLYASGPGYIRRLKENKQTGKAEEALLVSKTPKDGAHGLWPEEKHLYVVGDGGLWKYPLNSDGTAEIPSSPLLKVKTGDEHAAHAIKRGPDGKLYLLCGNMAGIDAKYASHPDSPVKKPIAGCLLRLHEEDGMVRSEIICHGFRNAYDMDWDLTGRLFTFDSDNERCLGLPWYEPTRFYRIYTGAHYGWLSPQKAQFWRMPFYFASTSIPEMVFERGSPTGVACYRHTQFPNEYQGNLFCCDWTFGRIHRIHFEKQDDDYFIPHKDVFLQTTGTSSLAITSIAVHPKSGDLFFSTGGRHTRGAIYRVRHEEGFRKHELKELPVPIRDFERIGSRVRPDDQADIRKNQLTAHYGLYLSDPVGVGTFREGYWTDGKFMNPVFSELADKIRTHDKSIRKDALYEAARAYSIMKDSRPEVFDWVLNQITDKSHPTDDVHFLFVLACLRNKVTEEQSLKWAKAWLNIDKKAEAIKLPRERHWPLRLSEAFAESVRRTPLLADDVVLHPEFGRPEHLIFVQGPDFPRTLAAKKFASSVEKNPNFPMSSRLAELLTTLPAEQVLPLLRSRCKNPMIQDAVIPSLCKLATAEDRPLLLNGLKSLNPSVIESCVTALERLFPGKQASHKEEMHALLNARMQAPTDAKKLLQKIDHRLREISGYPSDEPITIIMTRFQKEHPELKLNTLEECDRAAWDLRLNRIDWNRGEAASGEKHYQKLCASCHAGTSAIGPDLSGVGKRFNRADLLTTILEPSKGISGRYRTTLFETNAGQVYVGIIIYEAVDGVILQTGPHSTMRIPGNEVVSKRTHSRSLMPAGLMNEMKDQEIADLIRFLQGK